MESPLSPRSPRPAPPEPPRPLHHFTVDVEECFQVSAMEPWVDPASWGTRPSRVVAGTEALLRLLADAGVRGTFFTLGWVAERHPALVRAIADAGHELASHGWDHRRVTHLTPDDFRTQVRDSRRLLEDLSGTPVEGYRAPSFSIVPGREWALEILVEEGYRYDASLYPVRRRGYGYPEGARAPWVVSTPAGPLVEIPPATLLVAGRSLPAGGGGTFRQFPLAWTEAAFRQAEAAGRGATFYLHPWEVDAEQPRVAGLPALTRVRHYRGIPRALPRLRRLLNRFRFGSIREDATLAGLFRSAVAAVFLVLAACSPPDPGALEILDRGEAPDPLPFCASADGSTALDADARSGVPDGAPPAAPAARWEVREVATGLEVPWAIAPTPDGRLLVTERPGRVVAVDPEQGTVTPWLELEGVAVLEEAGLMGIALHPDFATNGYLYLVSLHDRRGGQGAFRTLVDRVRVRLGDDRARPWELQVHRATDQEGRGTDLRLVAGGILSFPLHAGGALHLPAADHLLLSVGDGFHPPASRDPGDPRGTLLRIPLDPATGLLPRGERPAAAAIGVRNSQGIHASGDQVFFIDHGPSGLDFEGNRMGKDELNVLPSGGARPPSREGRAAPAGELPDYGWPHEAGIHATSMHQAPLAEWTPAVAPAGLAARPLPGGEGHELFFTGLRGQALIRVETLGNEPVCQEPLLERAWGRLRAVALAEDGGVWVSTSNGDGRGTPNPGDDRILHLAPAR